MAKNLLVLSSGGDAPGMNSAIRAVVRYALFKGLNVFGCELGYQGLIDQKIFPMHAGSVANIIQRGGTILKTGRCLAFQDKAVRQKCIAFLAEKNIDYLAVLGGNGSFRGATLLEEEGGPKVVGLPCTIDNDIPNTEYCIGFDTARNTALDAIDKIRDTAASHNRHFIVEVMGRDAGFLAVDVGIAGGAEIILTPEFPMSVEQIIALKLSKSRKKLTSIMVVAEANDPGRSIKIAKEIEEQTQLDYKVCILGHTQRGGSPTAIDRKIATIMGAKAVETLINNQSRKMIAMVHDDIIVLDFPASNAEGRRFDDKALIELNNQICNI